MQNNIPSFEELQKHFPSSFYLYYVDYRDSIEDPQLLQKSIQKNTDEYINDLFIDDFYGYDEAYKEIEDVIKTNYEDNYQEILDKYNDNIRDYIYNNDKSTPCQDLINNTSDFICLYDMEYEMESESWSWNDEMIEEVIHNILEHLGLNNEEINDLKDDFTWKEMRNLVQNATYGGNLEIYFKASLDDLLTYVDNNQEYIIFDNISLGVVNHNNGSGYVTDGLNFSIKKRFNRNNLYVDKTLSYNWSHDIAGQNDYSTVYSIIHDPTNEVIKENKTSLQLFNEQQEKYDKIYNEGGCTYGDTKFSRHRNTVYINEYPCGTKCLSCNQFWID